MLLFATIEVAIIYLVSSALDEGVHKAARQVRVGVAQKSGWNLATFKRSVCGDLVYMFKCSDDLLVRATVVTDMASVTRISGISDGALSVTEAFDIGAAGDYVLVQAFLPWTPVLQYYSYSSDRLKDGRYVLAASELFKNEPF